MSPTADDWKSIGQIIGYLIGGAAVGFIALYRSFPRREETVHERLTSKSVGAAFVDNVAADNLTSIASDVKAIRNYVDDVVEKAEHEQSIKEAMARLKAAEEAKTHPQPPQG